MVPRRRSFQRSLGLFQNSTLHLRPSNSSLDLSTGLFHSEYINSKSNMLGLAILLLDSVSLLISIPIIVLTALVANSEKLKGKYASELWQNGSYNDFWSIVDIPYGTSYGSLKATLAAGCIGTVAGVVILFSFLCAAAPINRSRTGMIVSAATLLTTVIALVYSFAETYASDRVYQGPFRPNSHHLTVGVRGTYSVESWNCQTYDLRAPMQRGDSERWCALAVSINQIC